MRLLPLLVLSVHAHTTRSLYPLDVAQMAAAIAMDPPEWESTTEGHLGKLLVPRASGSENNTLVQDYISSVYSKLGWHEQKTTFTSDTPIGNVDFTNLIYTYNPDAPQRVVFAAHFDSKWFPNYPANQFTGATDSAAPCALLLSLSQFLTPLLAPLSFSTETTVQIVFLDGEEAFHDWTTSDSLYGARFLASHWEHTFLPPSHPAAQRAKRRLAPRPTHLATIQHFILLDLLGHPDPRLYSFFRETDYLFDFLTSIDTSLAAAGLLPPGTTHTAWFSPHRRSGGIADDHLPFLHRGVPVLHLIPTPFPAVWHTLHDDHSALDLAVLNRWNRLLRVFVCGYLGLVPAAGGVGGEAGGGVGGGDGGGVRPGDGRIRDDLVRPLANTQFHD